MKTPPSSNGRTRVSPLAMACCLLLAAMIVPADAATRIWIGREDPFWSNPANWTNGLVPVAGDSIEFLEDVIFRDTYNDLAPEMSLGSLHIKGRNYVLRGNKINLQDNIISQPGNSSNLITLNMNISAPLSIINYGYFNVLELAGEIVLYSHPLVLETSSSIRLSGLILDTNNMGVVQRSSGTVSFAPTGRVAGTIIVEQGELILGGGSANPNLYGVYKSELIVGTDFTPPGIARVTWTENEKLAADTLVKVHGYGRLDLNGFSQAVATLTGSGVIELDAGRLNIRGPAPPSAFAGELRGNGVFRVDGVEAGFELRGHNTFTGTVEVASLRVTNAFMQEVSSYSSRLRLSGSASNAVVVLQTNATCFGNGVARSLTARHAVVHPGPGTLRLLESFTLDDGSTLAVTLDGPEAGSIQAGSIKLEDAALEFTYHGGGLENQFTVIAANFATPGSRFQGLAESAWIIAGDPGSPSEFRLTYTGNAGHDVVLERTGWFVPPALNIWLSGGERVVGWPLSAQGYSLQQSLTLDPPAWTGDGLPAPAATATEFFVIDGGRILTLPP